MKLSKNVVKYSPLVISSLISYFMDYDTKFIDNLKKPSLYPPGTLFGIYGVYYIIIWGSH